MAVQAFKFYEMAREYIGDSTIDLDGAIFRMGLYQSSSNFATDTISQRTQATNEVADGNGYSTSGKTLSATAWITGASGNVRRFDSTAVIWTAAGGAINNIKAYVIWISGASGGAEKLLGHASLTSLAFSLASGNTLTLTPPVGAGIFEMT